MNRQTEFFAHLARLEDPAFSISELGDIGLSEFIAWCTDAGADTGFLGEVYGMALIEAAGRFCKSVRQPE